MIEIIVDYITMLTLGTYFYIFAILIAACAFFGAINASVIGGIRKFKKATKKFIKNPSQETLAVAREKMPKHLAHGAKHGMGEHGHGHAHGHGPHHGVDAQKAIVIPYNKSVAAIFPFAILVISLFSTILMYMIGNIVSTNATSIYTYVALIAVVGLICCLFANYVSSRIYRKGMKTFYKFKHAMKEIHHAECCCHDHHEPEEVVMENEYAEEEPATYCEPGEVQEEYVEQDEYQEEVEVYDEVEQDDEVDENGISDYLEPVTFDEPEPVEEEVEEEEPVIETEMTAFLQKVDAVVAQTATFAQIKMLALELSQERAKAQNQSPEMRKQFSEAQMKLLKAMKTAPRSYR